MNRVSTTFLTFFSLLLTLSIADDLPASELLATQVGVAKVDVTPTHRVLLAGYGARKTESEGIDTHLWARSLVIGDKSPLVLIAVDNCGVPARVVEDVAKLLQEKAKIKRAQLVISATHTHNAPNLRGYAPILWAGRTTDAQEKRVDQYTSWLKDKLVALALTALKQRQSATLSWGRGRVTFGGNRRVLTNGKWRGFGLQADSPVDHSLPIIVAKDAKGKPIAIWVNYACHCTTVGNRNRIGGDWAGFANEHIEQNHPGAIALTTIGCGADVGPQPTGSLRLADQHGQSLAKEVKRLLASELQPLTKSPSAKMQHLKLPFDKLPSMDHWRQQATKSDFHGQHAKLMLKTLKEKGKLPTHLDYPVTTWTFGDELAIVFLAGEVVVDYSVRLNKELDWERLWITAWSNDVPCYISSRRVLVEGGYESDFSMIYYAQPTRFDSNVEEVLVDGVKKMVGKTFRRKSGQKLAPFHRYKK